MDEEKMKQMQRGLMLKLMENMLKQAPHNVPQPLPVIEEKAQNRLNTDDLISWKLMLKEWQKVSAEGKKEIAKLLVINSHDIVETLDLHKRLVDETKDTINYVGNHPEWGKSKEEMDAQNAIGDFLKDLDLDD